jgi:signal peptidase I
LIILIFACVAAVAARADSAGVPVASSAEVKESRTSSRVSPGSTISSRQAALAAAQLKRAVPGTLVYAVKPTGSMRPLFDGNCLLLTEPAAFSELEVGDIVVFRHSRTGDQIVHRILERRSSGFWTKGDHNGRMDDEMVTPANYISRVYGIIYTERNNQNRTPDAITGSAELSAMPN